MEDVESNTSGTRECVRRPPRTCAEDRARNSVSGLRQNRAQGLTEPVPMISVGYFIRTLFRRFSGSAPRSSSRSPAQHWYDCHRSCLLVLRLPSTPLLPSLLSPWRFRMTESLSTTASRRQSCVTTWGSLCTLLALDNNGSKITGLSFTRKPTSRCIKTANRIAHHQPSALL